ncbi:MAG: ring-cleaving dioxygenase [Candidatus Dormibacterales bacterium]
MPENVPGIHHVTAITGDVQRNVDFYVGVLGLRFIKKTVNFDVPDTYHVYFGDHVGTPGTAMTYFGWPHLPHRAQGTGQVLAVSFAVPAGSIGFWADRLRAAGIEVAGAGRFGLEALSLEDPDGIRLELVGEASDDRWSPWEEGPVEPRHAIRGFHSVGLLVGREEPTARFLLETMGFRETGREEGRLRLETGPGGAGASVEVLVDAARGAGEEAAGTVHHVAWRATGDEHQLAWRAALQEADRRVTPVIERKYFRSVYFREPGGVLFEIATDGPGFTVDEPVQDLGGSLQLPPQYEDRRGRLDFDLPPITVPDVSRSRAR